MFRDNKKIKAILFVFVVLFTVVTSSVYSGTKYDKFIFKTKKESNYMENFLKIFHQKHFNSSYAIVISIGKYKYLPHLESAEKDAKKIKDYLLSTGEYDEVVVLQDADADFDTIRYFMQTYFSKKMQEKGRYRFLFYFSGHGAQFEGYGSNTIGYLLLKNAKGILSDMEMIEMNHIEGWANRFINATHMLFLLDSCFSGLAGSEIKNYDTSANLSDLAKENGRYMITAGGAKEASIADLKRWSGSLFTEMAVDGMKGSADFNHDSVVTTYELFSYVQVAVKNEAERAGHSQNPLMSNLGEYTDKGQYFFIYQEHKLTQKSGGKIYEKDSETTLSDQKIVGSELVDYIIPSPYIISRGNTLKIKIKTHSSKVRIFGFFHGEKNKKIMVEGRNNRKEGGNYISYQIPKDSSLGLQKAKIVIQELGTMNEESYYIEYKIIN